VRSMRVDGLSDEVPAAVEPMSREAGASRQAVNMTRNDKRMIADLLIRIVIPVY